MAETDEDLPMLGTTYTAVADLGTILVLEWEMTLRPWRAGLVRPLVLVSCFSWMVVARGEEATPLVGLRARLVGVACNS